MNTQIEQMITNSQRLFEQYKTISQSQSFAITQGLAAQETLINRESRLSELNRLTSTYEQEFLDRKRTPKAKSFFGKMGLLSVQDWSIALFYFSYVLFCIMIFVLVMVHTTQRLRAGVILFVLFLIIGYGSTAAILLLG